MIVLINKMKFGAIFVAALILAPVFVYGLSVPDISEDNVIDFRQAPQYIGGKYWVRGEVNNIARSEAGNYFINFCSDFRTCPFSSVVFSEHASNFTNIESWKNRELYIYGEISMFDGRSQIIIENRQQVRLATQEVVGANTREGAQKNKSANFWGATFVVMLIISGVFFGVSRVQDSARERESLLKLKENEHDIKKALNAFDSLRQKK